MSKQVLENPREIRGFAILAQSNQISQLDSKSFDVRSQSGNGNYHVSHKSGWVCTCPDHITRQVECKHILSVKFWIELRKNIGQQDIFQLHREITELTRCEFCGSTSIMKWGKRETKQGTIQRYRCRDCGKSFVSNDGFSRMKVDPRVITVALDLYFKGVSLRKITDHVNQFYGLDISHVGVFKWIRKYAELITNYVNRLEPELSGVWHADEMKIRCEGKWKWLWNVMDENTRFLISNHVSDGREIKDARAPFFKALAIAGEKPEVIITDGLQSYIGAYKKEFWTLRNPRTKHIRSVGLRSRINNNVIERYHGTARERDKVMRGLKGEESAQVIADGFRTYYNFIRPHSVLWKTPAEEANINLELGQNKWMSLIRESARNRERF